MGVKDSNEAMVMVILEPLQIFFIFISRQVNYRKQLHPMLLLESLH